MLWCSFDRFRVHGFVAQLMKSFILFSARMMPLRPRSKHTLRVDASSQSFSGKAMSSLGAVSFPLSQPAVQLRQRWWKCMEFVNIIWTWPSKKDVTLPPLLLIYSHLDRTDVLLSSNRLKETAVVNVHLEHEETMMQGTLCQPCKWSCEKNETVWVVAAFDNHIINMMLGMFCSSWSN